MSVYCTIDDVIDITQTTAEKMGIDSEKYPDKLEQVLTKWIKYASALIDDYTCSPLTEIDIEDETTKKLVYEDVCSRIVANRCALSEAYKNYAVITMEDWNLGRIPENIFNDDLKKALNKYKIEEEGEKASNIGMYVVTGEDLWK